VIILVNIDVMAQTKIGAMKSAAKSAGLSFEDFIGRVERGEKRCTRCKLWKPIGMFGNDCTRGDGKDSSCFDCRRVKVRICTKGRNSPFKGMRHSTDAKRIMSEKRKGTKAPWKQGQMSAETRRKISEITKARTPRGENHYAWKNGSTQRLHDDRRKAEYRVWRDAVFNRDAYTCQKCGDEKGGNLRAHHIKPFATHKELRFEISNGITLCHTCHELEHFKPDSIRNVRKLKRGERLWK